MAEDERIGEEYGGRTKTYRPFAEETELMAEQMKKKETPQMIAAQTIGPKKKKLRKMGAGKLRPVDGFGPEGDESL
jgi:hypothetical protein